MIDNLYLWLKAFHIISLIAWMAGLLYLPRLYVYHCMATKDGELDRTLQIMEKKLLRYIMNPAMILTFLFGIWLIIETGHGAPGTGGWLHVKLGLVLLLAAFHGMCAKWRKNFANGSNTRSGKFYRWANEFPTILLIVIVLLAILKPL